MKSQAWKWSDLQVNSINISLRGFFFFFFFKVISNLSERISLTLGVTGIDSVDLGR